MKQCLLILCFLQSVALAEFIELEELQKKYKNESQKIEEAFQVSEEKLRNYCLEYLLKLEKSTSETGEFSKELVIRKEREFFEKNGSFETALQNPDIRKVEEFLEQKRERIRI